MHRASEELRASDPGKIVWQLCDRQRWPDDEAGAGCWVGGLAGWRMFLIEGFSSCIIINKLYYV